jgi:hypothetical protein
MPRVAAPEEEAMSDAPAPSPPPAPSAPAVLPAEAPAKAGSARLITASCALGLLGIGFSLAHFLWPTPLLFALFMIVGQGSFGLALLLYVIAIFTDLRRKKVL